MITLREIREEDSAALLQLNKMLDRESKFMLLEADERKLTEEQQREMLRDIIRSDNSHIFVAEAEGQLVGRLSVMGGNTRRIRHRAEIVIGILQEYGGQGIGRKLFEMAERWRQNTALIRLELTVMTHNSRAIALYKKMGFTIEGLKKHSMKVDGRYVDEYLMAKIYDDQ